MEEEKKVPTAGAKILLGKLSKEELSALVDFKDSKFYDVFVKIEETAVKEVLAQVQGVRNYDNAKVYLRDWQTTMNIWKSFLSMSDAAQLLLESGEEEK